MWHIVPQNSVWQVYPLEAQIFVRAWQQGDNSFTIQTSGSTGAPKTIEVTRGQLTASAQATGRALGYGPRACQLVALDLSRIGGLMCVVRGLIYGWSFAFTEPAADPFAQSIDGLQVDHTSLVPLQVEAVLANPASARRLAGLQTVLVGGAGLNPVLEAVLSHIEGPAVYHTFGMSETVSHIALRRLNGPEPQARFTLLDEVEARQDERGCLAVRGPMTAGVWVQSQDVVEMEGRSFTFLGRADAVINTGGVKVHPEQIEAFIGPLLAHVGYIGTYQIKGRPDARLGERVALLLEGEDRGEAWTQHLLSQAKALLGPYQTPRQLYWVDALPRTPGGKLERRG